MNEIEFVRPHSGLKVSIILPTYNEARSIIALIEAIRSSVPSGWGYEIITVDTSPRTALAPWSSSNLRGIQR